MSRDGKELDMGRPRTRHSPRREQHAERRGQEVALQAGAADLMERL